VYEVQQTRWDRIIRRVSGSIGPGSRVSETVSELFPMIDVERVPGELLLLGGTQMCLGQSSTNPSAVLFPLSSVFNPANSGQLITITHIRVSSNVAQSGQGGPSLNILANPGTQAVRDTRRGPVGQPVGQVLTELLLAPAPNFYRFALRGNVDLVIEDPNGIAVLGPGTSFILGGTSINTALRVGYMWRERPAELAELSL